MKKYILGIAVFIAICCTNCKEDEKGGEIQLPAEVNTLEITGINDESWTYVSFESGKVVGHSELGNTNEDTEWAARKDWDIALCGELLKTNSGTSGEGKGGIISVNDKSFNAIDIAPTQGYLVDTNNIVVKR